MHRHMKMKALTVTSNLLTLVPFQVSKWLLLEPSCVCFLMQSNTDAKPLFDSRYSWPFWKTKNLQTRLHPSSSQSGCHTAFWLKVRATPLEMKHLHLWSSPLEMKHLHLRNSQPWRQTTFFVLTLNLDAKTTFLFFVCLKNNTLNPDAKPQFFSPSFWRCNIYRQDYTALHHVPQVYKCFSTTMSSATLSLHKKTKKSAATEACCPAHISLEPLREVFSEDTSSLGLMSSNSTGNLPRSFLPSRPIAVTATAEPSVMWRLQAKFSGK